MLPEEVLAGKSESAPTNAQRRLHTPGDSTRAAAGAVATADQIGQIYLMPCAWLYQIAIRYVR